MPSHEKDKLRTESALKNYKMNTLKDKVKQKTAANVGSFASLDHYRQTDNKNNKTVTTTYIIL